MTSYKIRITTELLKVSEEETVEWLKNNKYINRYYIVKEVGKDTKKRHIQGWLELSYNTSKLTMRQVIRRYAEKHRIKEEYKGNTLYSFSENKELYPVEYLCYLMKEDENPETNLEEEHLKKAQERNVKEFKEPKKKKETITQVIENIEKIILEEYEQKQLNIEHIGDYEIVRHVIAYHKEKRRRFVENQVISICQTIALNLKENNSDLVDRIEYRAFRNPLLNTR